MRGQLLIAGRVDLGERYLARMIAPGRFGADPIVRVLAVIRYPRQHALYWPDVAIEIPPIEAGCICRLHILSERANIPRICANNARVRGKKRRLRLYAGSLERARREAAKRARTAGEMEILARHGAGEVRRARQVRRYNRWEAEKERCAK